MRNVLVYDGSFEGFLTTIFKIYDEKLTQVFIQPKDYVQNSLFGHLYEVTPDAKKALRVWNGLRKKLSYFGVNQILYAFLSEQNYIENLLLNYIEQVFASPISIEKDYANDVVLDIVKIARSVGREKHRMEAFVRFKQTKDNVYFANIEPDFNVLPLIIKHFKKRYSNQKWLIYDVKRNYGYYYNLKDVEQIHLDFPKHFDSTKTSEDVFSTSEIEFQGLWKNYFKSVTIKERKNTKVHVNFLPKRYWKYLIEKQ